MLNVILIYQLKLSENLNGSEMKFKDVRIVNSLGKHSRANGREISSASQFDISAYMQQNKSTGAFHRQTPQTCWGLSY